MKPEDMKGKYLVLVDYKKILPEEGLVPDKEGCISYKIDKNIIEGIHKVKITLIESKIDPLDGFKTFRLFYKSKEKSGSLKFNYKETFIEINSDTYINKALLPLKDQILDFLV